MILPGRLDLAVERADAVRNMDRLECVRHCFCIQCAELRHHATMPDLMATLEMSRFVGTGLDELQIGHAKVWG